MDRKKLPYWENRHLAYHFELVNEVVVTNGARVFQPVYENGLENPFSVCFARLPFLHRQTTSRRLDKVCDKVRDKVFGDAKSYLIVFSRRGRAEGLAVCRLHRLEAYAPSASISVSPTLCV